jgi:glycosyltransferase involved in cell wall biosynthesis
MSSENSFHAGRIVGRAREGRMRIEFLVPAPFDLVTGGYGYDRRITAGLRDAGHSVTVHELDGQHPWPDDVAIASARATWAVLPAESVVVIDNLGLASFDGLEAELAARGVVVLNHHPTGMETGLSVALADGLIAIEQKLMPLAHRVIATSTTTAATLRERFSVLPAHLTVVEPGTEAAPRSMGSGGGTVQILSIGSLIPRKGHDVLMRALAKLFDLDWRLTIAGSARHDPACAAALQALPEGLGIAARVRFLGEMTGAPLAELWQQADLFALATEYEGYGMAIAEALKRGLPVAVCNGGAAAALVRPEYGVVCHPGDVEQLSKALRRLIFDARLRGMMAEAAWHFGQTLPDWTKQAEIFAQALA